MNLFGYSKRIVLSILTGTVFALLFIGIKNTNLTDEAHANTDSEVVFNSKQIRENSTVNYSIDKSIELSANKIKLDQLGKPTKIVVPKLNVTIDVVDGHYINGEWTLGSDYAYYATITPQLNAPRGGTVIYGHNIPQIFQKLSGLEIGDNIQVYTSTGHIVEYKYYNSELVAPTDANIFMYDGEPRLTLLTCNGWLDGRLDEYRRLMHFKLDKIVG